MNQPNNLVISRREDDIGRIIIDNPPVNAISQRVRQELLDAVIAADEDKSVHIIIITGAGDTFIAGGDLSEFDRPAVPPHLPDLVLRISACSKPVLAMLNGNALGGGLEIALGCHYRIAGANAHLGFPEVNVGVIPGAGGTQILPRVAGLKTALEMITSGRPTDAANALSSGLIDHLYDGDDLQQECLRYARQLVTDKAPPRRLAEKPIGDDATAQELINTYRQTVAHRRHGQAAPRLAVDAIALALTKTLADGMKQERACFLERRSSAESRAMRHIFHAERSAARPTATAGVDRNAVRKIDSAAVIGAGIMGSGIAINLLDAGLAVTLVDKEQSALQRGRQKISDNYDSQQRKGRLTKAEYEKRLSLLTSSTALADIADKDIIIEAVFEDMKLKKDMFRQLDQHCRHDAILASNTSTLDIDEIADVTRHPENVLGLHFFSPAHIMKLLEVVRGARTAPATSAAAFALARRLRKIAVLAGVCDGFIGNRMYHQYVYESNRLLLEGASPEQVDAALHDFGFAMGPFQVGDLSGLDIGYSIRQQRRARGVVIDQAASIVPDKLVEAGDLGQKTGCGFYLYEKGVKTTVNPKLAEIISEARRTLDVQRREISDQEIVNRCLNTLINQGAFILDEGIAECGSDIDVVWTNGYGFPRHRGGPMHYADAVGLETVIDQLDGLEKRYGDRWQASTLLQRRVRKGTPLSDTR